MMPVRTALKLGRVSNLPTVWTNVIAGVALVGAEPKAPLIISVGVAVSLLYVAGMFLNDAFDAKWDAEHRAERPIPMGEVSARAVFQAGFGMMAAGLIVLLVGPGGSRAILPGLVLAGLIVLYDVSHKKNPASTIVMGLCRAAVYFTAARAASEELAAPLFFGSAFLLSYLITLSLVARQEGKNPKLRARVGLLIAGISLVDGAQVLALEHWWLALACLGGFVLTLRLQKRVAGT